MRFPLKFGSSRKGGKGREGKTERRKQNVEKKDEGKGEGKKGRYGNGKERRVG